VLCRAALPASPKGQGRSLAFLLIAARRSRNPALLDIETAAGPPREEAGGVRGSTEGLRASFPIAWAGVIQG